MANKYLRINNTYDVPLKETFKNLDNNKQDTLVSGTNIKTINGTSLLGSGNLVIEGGSPIISTVTSATVNTVTFYCYDQEWTTQDVSGTNIHVKATKNNNILYIQVFFNFDSTWYNAASFNKGTFEFTIPSSVLSPFISGTMNGEYGGNIVVSQLINNSIQEYVYTKALTEATYSSILYLLGPETSSISITRDLSFPEDTTQSYGIHINYTCILDS